MADFPNQNNTNTTPYYQQPLTSDFNVSNNSTPYSNNNQNQLQIKENQQNSSKDNNTYTSPFDAFQGCCQSCVYSISIFFFVISLTEFFITFNFAFLVGILPSLVFPISTALIFQGVYSIRIEPLLGTITLTRKKFFFSCFNKKKIIQINEIQQVIVENYIPEDLLYGNSRVIFKLVDGKEVKGLDIYDKDKKEGRNVFFMIKNNLPQSIPFGGNLAY